MSIKDKVTVLEDSELLTAIVPSKSNPRKPHIVVFCPDGECERQDCPNYSSLSVCAHAIAASVKTGSLSLYVTWLLTKKRKRQELIMAKQYCMGCQMTQGGNQVVCSKDSQNSSLSSTQGRYYSFIPGRFLNRLLYK